MWDVRLEVMVAVYGRDAIEGVSLPGRLEETPGVRYLVSWQIPDGEPAEIPVSLSAREDVKAQIMRGKGVSRNRNALLAMASAPYVLFADDDIEYKSENLREIIDVLDSNPTVDLAIFKVKIDEPRRYPSRATDLVYSKWKQNYYPIMFEAAARLDQLRKATLLFNEEYGTNAPVFGSGEEDIFFYDAWKAGLKLRFFPIEILSHPDQTTIVRKATDISVIMARGGVLRHIYGRLSWLRRLKLACALPGNKFRNWELLRAGARYEAGNSKKRQK